MKKIFNFLYRFLYWFLFFIRRYKGFGDSFPISHPEWNKRGIAIWYYQTIKPLFGMDVQYRRTVYSNDKIDVVIPAIDKDAEMLSQVVASIRKHVKHPIGNIYIVAPRNSQVILQMVKKLRCIFIDESTVLPFSKTKICYYHDGKDRSGWLFQQLIKMSIDEISQSKYVLVCDADTMFVRDKVFTYRRRCILDQSIEHHQPYYDVYRKMFSREPGSLLSFVCHNMIFNRDWLIELKHELENIHNMLWWDVILKETNYSDISGFSEYETYGNYCLRKHRKEIRREFWWNYRAMSIGETCQNYYKTYSNHIYT